MDGKTENTIYTVNKAGSNAVYVVFAMAFILTASAKISSKQSGCTFQTCIAAQRSLNFDDGGGNFQGMSYSGMFLRLRNIGSEASGPESDSELHWVSSGVFDNNQPFSPASVAISFVTDVLRAPFTGHFFAPSGQDAKYRFAYLKRDPVYVRSKS
jgi:hypothetical protein